MVDKIIKVLLAEGDPELAELFRSMLADSEQAFFQVDQVAHLKSCLAALRQKKYDALLLDLFLPDSLGIDTVRSVRKQDSNIPIVVLKGQKKETPAKDLFKAGAQEFIAKAELNGTSLRRVIRYAIERRALELESEQPAAELGAHALKEAQRPPGAEDQWKEAFDAVPDPIAIVDKDFRIIKHNIALAKVTGSNSQDVTGRFCYEVMRCDNYMMANCPHEMLLQDRAEHIEEIHSPALGLDLLVSASPIYDEKGLLSAGVLVARDISMIKKAQRSIAESERLHRMFMDSLPDPTVVYNNEGKVVYSNAAFERVFGWSMDEVRDRKMDFVPPEALPKTLEKIEQMKRGIPLVDFETQRLNKSGEKLNVRINTAPLFDAEGKQTGNIVNLRDVSAIRRAEAAQRASEQRYRELVETMNEGLTMADPKGRIVYTNAAFCNMLGHPPGKLAGQLFEDLLVGDSREAFKKHWSKRHAGEEKKYEVVLKTKDGGFIFAIISPKIVRDNEGRMIGSFAIVTDITERKNLESQLIQAQKLEGIGQLAAGIAHEINTPTQYVLSNTGFLQNSFHDLMALLKAYRNFTESIKGKGLETEQTAGLDELIEELDFEFLADEIPHALEANREGLERIAKIVLSIKEFAHPGQEEKQPADLNKAIENTITVARNEWKYLAEVETNLDPALPLVPCVVGEINQVILNLIVNATHAIGEVQEEGQIGLIRISTANMGNFVEIKVSDNGPGIPEKIRSRIFDPFFTTKEPGKGTGQGLALAHRSIVTNHQGEISFDSREGGGTTFTIRLPMVEKGAE
jgi:two-component system NtrC family sensor kinase